MKPSLYKQLLYLRANMLKLSNWEKRFVRNTLEGSHGQGGLMGHGDDPSDHLILEEISDKQAETIKRLYEEASR